MLISVRRRIAMCRTAAIGLFLYAPTACGSNGSSKQPGAAGVVWRDSAGIVIIETPSVLARAPIGWIVGDAPDLQLGSVAGDMSQQFHLIGPIVGGMAQLPDGGIVVVNGGSGELRFFDRGGRFLYQIGGLGDGPGEFRSPQLVPYPSSDSLMVFDTRQRRFTLLSSDGRTHHDFPRERLPPNLLTGAARGANRSGILMTSALGTLPIGQDGPYSYMVGVRWINIESRTGEVVAESQVQLYRTSEVGELPYSLDVPFSPRLSAVIGRQGFFVTTGGETPEVREYDSAGRLTRVFRVVEAPRPVTREDLESVIAFQASRFGDRTAQALRAYEQMAIPDRWPSFQSLRVDRLGWIWAEIYRPRGDEVPKWMVFSPDGISRGIVEVPHGLEIHDFGADYLLGRFQDDLRVEYVRRYSLARAR